MSSETDDNLDRERGTKLMPRFNDSGLVTAVAQERTTGEILMLAHVNELALQKTIETGFAHFWSRSRASLWMKGETSGNRLAVQEIRIDCDQDALIMIVDLEGSGACHTGAKSCFYRRIVKADGEIKLEAV